jgi:hypothetical protein
MARSQACLTREATHEELRELWRRVAARGIAHRDHQRALVVLAVLLVLDGAALAAAGRKAGCCGNTAAVWCRRFQAHGLASLVDRPKPGAPTLYAPADRLVGPLAWGMSSLGTRSGVPLWALRLSHGGTGRLRRAHST